MDIFANASLISFDLATSTYTINGCDNDYLRLPEAVSVYCIIVNENCTDLTYTEAQNLAICAACDTNYFAFSN